MNYAFVMYNNLGEWLSPAAAIIQPVAVGDNVEYHDYDDGEIVDETPSNDTRQSRVVNSVIISLATSSSLIDRLNLTEPLSFTLSHIHVRTFTSTL